MNNGRRFFAEMLKHLSFFIMFVSMALPSISWASGNGRLIYVYALILPFFVMISVKQVVDSLFLFAVPQLLLVASVLVWPLELIPKLTVFVFMVLSLIYSFTDRLSEKDQGVTIAFVALIGGVNIAAGWISSYGKLDIPAGYFVFNMLISILCYILHAHMTDISDSLDAISLTSVQPVKNIKKFNNAAIALFVAMATVAALLSKYIPVAAALRGLGDLLLAVLRFLASLGNGPQEAPEEVAMMQDMPGDPDMFGMPEPSEPFIFWVILEKIVMFLVTAALIAGVIAGVAYLFYKLYKRFYATKRAYLSDVAEFAAPEANFIRFAGRLADMVPFINFAPVNKARRAFYKKVRRHMKKGLEVRAHQTARDIAAEIKKAEDIGELTDAYEVARYLD